MSLLEVSVESERIPTATVKINEVVKSIISSEPFNPSRVFDFDISEESDGERIFYYPIVRLPEGATQALNTLKEHLLKKGRVKEIGQKPCKVSLKKPESISIHLARVNVAGKLCERKTPVSIAFRYTVSEGVSESKKGSVCNAFLRQKILPPYGYRINPFKSSEAISDRLRCFMESPYSCSELVSLFGVLNPVSLIGRKYIDFQRIRPQYLHLFFSSMPYPVELVTTGKDRYAFSVTLNDKVSNPYFVELTRIAKGFTSGRAGTVKTAWEYKRDKILFSLWLLVRLLKDERDEKGWFFDVVRKYPYLVFYLDFKRAIYSIAGLLFYAYNGELNSDNLGFLRSLKKAFDKLDGVVTAEEDSLELVNSLSREERESLTDSLRTAWVEIRARVASNAPKLLLGNFKNTISDVLDSLEGNHAFDILEKEIEEDEDEEVVRVSFAGGDKVLKITPEYHIYDLKDMKNLSVKVSYTKPDRTAITVVNVVGEEKLYDRFAEAVKSYTGLATLKSILDSRAVVFHTPEVRDNNPSSIVTTATEYLAFLSHLEEIVKSLPEDVDSIFLLNIYQSEGSMQYSYGKDTSAVVPHILFRDGKRVTVSSAGVNIGSEENLGYRLLATERKLRLNGAGRKVENLSGDKKLAVILVNPYTHTKVQSDTGELKSYKSTTIFARVVVIGSEEGVLCSPLIKFYETAKIVDYLSDLGIKKDDYVIVSHNGVKLAYGEYEQLMDALQQSYRVMRYYSRPIIFDTTTPKDIESLAAYNDDELIFIRIKELGEKLKKREFIHRAFVLNGVNFAFSEELVTEILSLIVPNVSRTADREEIKTRFLETYMTGTDQYKFLNAFSVRVGGAKRVNIALSKIAFNLIEDSRKNAKNAGK